MIDETLQWAISRIVDITAGEFYGSVTLKYESGKMVRMESQQSERPPPAPQKMAVPRKQVEEHQF